MEIKVGSVIKPRNDIEKFLTQNDYKFNCDYSYIVFLKNDKIKTIVLFDNYYDRNIDIHYFGPNTCTLSKFRVILRYVFVQLKCERLTARIPSNNIILNKLLLGLSFMEEARLKNYYLDSDQIVYTLWRNKAQKYIELE